LAARRNSISGDSERQKLGSVREVALPPEALALSALSRVDYSDAFWLETRHVREKTGEEWARALLEDAPAATRMTLRRGWIALGVRLGTPEDERLGLGWTVRHSSPEFAVLAARSLIGLDAEVLVKREQDALLVATIMKLENPVARVVWAAVSPRHRRVVRHLVKEAGRRAGESATRKETNRKHREHDRTP